MEAEFKAQKDEMEARQRAERERMEQEFQQGQEAERQKLEQAIQYMQSLGTVMCFSPPQFTPSAPPPPAVTLVSDLTTCSFISHSDLTL